MFKKLRRFSKARALPKIGQGFSLEKMPAVKAWSRPAELGVEEDPLEKLAKQGVLASLPERIVWAWLERKGYSFTMQAAELGGRNQVGGAVVDFVVWDMASRPVAIRIQGQYWHGPSFPGRRARDDEQAAKLRMKGYLVVDLWEQQVYEYALTGHLGQLIDRLLV